MKVVLLGLEVYSELLPGIRMRTRRRLPKNMGAGLVGAEAFTWAAISPSLLPRPWWTTALNVSISQGVGHGLMTFARFLVVRTAEIAGIPLRPLSSTKFSRALHIIMAGTTVVVTASSFHRQHTQAQLVSSPNKSGRDHAIVGLLVGTLGYGVILLVGESVQHSIQRVNKELRRWLPPVVSWPLASAAVAAAITVFSNRVLITRALNSIGQQAQEKNLSIFPGSIQPLEPERSGSPASCEKWEHLGSQGRALVSSGPRARDVAHVTGLPVEETRNPIRIYVGMIRGRSYQQQARQAIREMERTGAFERSTVVMMAAAGTGWLTDWSVSAVEFLTGGDCAVVAMQYSYLPSAVAYLTERDSPVESSDILIRAISQRLADLPEDNRPRFYVAGESLGAYGISDSFTDVEDLLARVDGAVFTGPPRFTKIHRDLTNQREPGSPERLPVIDGGRHVRFAAVPEHTRITFDGSEYRTEWEYPRVVFAQHASDPITFWDANLFVAQPAWLREPGSRGVLAPEAQQLDVFQGMRWFPFVTGWQVGLDQINSLSFPGGHAHQYHRETIFYWAGVLGEHARVEVDEAMSDRFEDWVNNHMIKR